MAKNRGAAHWLSRLEDRLHGMRLRGGLRRGLVPTVILNLIITGPTYALVRRLFRPIEPNELSAEVQLLG